MTTIIRYGNMAYADSCVTMSSGSVRTTRYTVAKLSKHKSNKCVIGIAGRVLDEPEIYDAINKFIDDLLVALKDPATCNINVIGHKLTLFMRQKMRDLRPDDYVPKYDGMVTFIMLKEYTVAIRLNDGEAICSIHNGKTVMCIGSGGALFTGLTNLNVGIEEKLKAVFTTDTHSGGKILRVDLNKLEDL